LDLQRIHRMPPHMAADRGGTTAPAILLPPARTPGQHASRDHHPRGPPLRMLDRILGLFSRDIGIDLGTANTLVHVRDRGIVISEPSVVAIEARTKRVLAIGAEAKR